MFVNAGEHLILRYSRRSRKYPQKKLDIMSYCDIMYIKSIELVDIIAIRMIESIDMNELEKKSRKSGLKIESMMMYSMCRFPGAGGNPCN